MAWPSSWLAKRAGGPSSQAGIFEGMDPTVWQAADPIILFIIQAAIVISLTRLLYWPLSKIREPRVIAEVITGVILGPSIMGRIPGFTEHIFPPESMPSFRLAANLGLVLFLFLIGLEINLRYLLSNWRVALSVASLDMCIPFGFGVAVAWGLYNDFSDEPGLAPNISFGVFALFIGVAMAITAFPVLCRILTSLKLLNTNVGVIVLSSGIANDVVGWVLLALCVTLVNSGAGVTAVYVLLTAVGWALFLAFAVRPAFLWILRRTGSLENGPSEGIVALTLLMVLTSAFFTSVIGVHSIFGAFMVGLICPHEGGFAIKLTEKIEDLISALLVPLFFANAGLGTNLALLDSGLVWGYVVAIIVIAFLSKIIGGTMGARLNGLVWRESFTIGTLMSCKGLVELIVLNIGLQAGILSTRTFTMFVVMALVTTFATAPAVSFLYPPAYQRKLQLWKQGKINWDGTPIAQPGDEEEVAGGDAARRIVAYLRIDNLPSLFSTLSLFTSGHRSDDTSSASADEKTAVVSSSPQKQVLHIHGHRLIELSERRSSVMQSSEIEEYAEKDPIIRAFGTCANNTTRDVIVSGQLAVVPKESFAETLVNRARDSRSDLLLLPWSETGAIADFSTIHLKDDPLHGGAEFGAFAGEVFAKAKSVTAVAAYLDSSQLRSVEGGKPKLTRQTSHLSIRSGISEIREPNAVKFHSAEANGKRRIYVLFSGYTDDLHALRLALQMASSENVELTIVNGAASDAPSYGDVARLVEASQLGSRITTVEMTTAHGGNLGLLVSGFLSSRAASDKNALLIVGRSISAAVGDAADVEGALGQLGGAVAAEVRKTAGNVNVSLMIVQAKRTSEMEAAEKKLAGETFA